MAEFFSEEELGQFHKKKKATIDTKSDTTKNEYKRTVYKLSMHITDPP